MNIKIECADCESPLPTYTKLDGDTLLIMVDVCPQCVARKIMLAEDADWVRDKMLKEGGVSGHELHKSSCKCRDCQDERGDAEYQKRKDDALTEAA